MNKYGNKNLYTVQIANMTLDPIYIAGNMFDEKDLLVITTVPELVKVFDNIERSYVPDSFLAGGDMTDIKKLILVMKGNALEFRTDSLFDIDGKYKKHVKSLNNLNLSFMSYNNETKLLEPDSMELFFFTIDVEDINHIEDLNNLFEIKHVQKPSIQIEFFGL